MKKLKIAYLLPSLGISGGVGVVFQHANRLRVRGHDVWLGSQAPPESTDWFPGQKVPTVPVSELPVDLDILVATSWATSFQVAQMTARRKCYFVQSDESRFHEPDSPWAHITLLSYFFNFHFITEARWIQEWLQLNFNKSASLVPNGLDPELFHATRPLAPKGSKPRVLLEGAIGLPYKGMKEAFEVVRDLDVEVWCVSSFGKPEPDWKCHRFFEQVPMWRMKEIYSSCDVLLKLSRVEGFFGPPLEMMGCGGVSVVGKVTGHDEYIVAEENALVVDPLDIDGARMAVKRLLEDRKLYNKIKANGFETAKRWDWEKSIDTLENFYLEISDKQEFADPTKIKINNSICFLFKNLTTNQQVDFEEKPYEIFFKRCGNVPWIRKMVTHIYFHLKRNKNIYNRLFGRFFV